MHMGISLLLCAGLNNNLMVYLPLPAAIVNRIKIVLFAGLSIQCNQLQVRNYFFTVPSMPMTTSLKGISFPEAVTA